MDIKSIVIVASDLNGLGAVRSAAYAGLTPILLLFDPADLAATSRYSRFVYLLRPMPTVDEFVDKLKLIFTEHGPCSIVTCSDAAAELLSKGADELRTFHHFAVPGEETIRLLNDKKHESVAVAAAEVNLPSTLVNLRDPRPPTLPLLVKPRTHRDYDILGMKNLLITSVDQWRQFKHVHAESIDRFVAQEVISGRDEELWVCNVTFDRNCDLRACFIFQRLGTMPSHYGVTSLAVSRRNEILIDQCKRIGKALSYTGPAMIEFKRCPRRNKYFYIETNPRLGMCNWFDTRCGVNNILASHKVSLDELVPPMSQVDGKVYVNFLGDIIARMEDRESPLSVVSRYAKLVFRRKVGAVFYWKDPLPWLMYTHRTLRSVFYRVMKRVRRYAVRGVRRTQ